MKTSLTKHQLIKTAEKVRSGARVDADLVDPFLAHTFPETSTFGRYMLKLAAGLSLFFASVLVIFPEVGEYLIGVLPGFFLLPERLVRALDYVWSLVGKPVGKQHLMYHMPNIIIYSFGVVGVRQIWRRLHKNNWKDQVEDAQEKLDKSISAGTGRFIFRRDFSLLFVGDGDQVGKSLVLKDPTLGPTISSRQPTYTRLWGKFVNTDGDEGIVRLLDQFNAQDANEYMLFPVLDDQLFLPGPHEYDIPPHRVEISVRRIREFENTCDWAPKKIVIVGDKEQKSRFVTSCKDGKVAAEDDEVSLRTIEQDYENVTVVDPTELTLKHIIKIADGRQIFFRASDRGAEKYSERFYHRLSLSGYHPTSEDTLVVGYDISDLDTEHQVVSKKNTGYLPVILSQEVFDLLSKSYLAQSPHIFVPQLLQDRLSEIVADDKASRATG